MLQCISGTEVTEIIVYNYKYLEQNYREHKNNLQTFCACKNLLGYCNFQLDFLSENIRANVLE